jgi:hypothetical protein
MIGIVYKNNYGYHNRFLFRKYKYLLNYSTNDNFYTIQSNLPYVTFYGNIEIRSHKTGGHYIQVYLIGNALWMEI